jgi:hypothetical protein
MTHIRPGLGDRGDVPPLPPSLSLRSAPICLDPGDIQAVVRRKRAEIAGLEADWAAASERAAARCLGGIDRLGDRETWDRTTWGRYLAAATQSQDLYLPSLRRLYAEVEGLERLQDPLPPSGRRIA